MPAKTLNVALIGYKFMGKAHSQAWRTVGRFFDLDAEPVMKVICGRDADGGRRVRQAVGLGKLHQPTGTTP